ncbi:MAG: hypothetical protein Q9224_006046, partial [Gallowayella concinna]
MEQFTNFRTVLFRLAKKEFNAFEAALEEELARRDEDHALKVNGLQDEIIGLRQQVIQINKLEQQVQQLRENTSTRHSPSSNRAPSYPNKPQDYNEQITQHPSHAPQYNQRAVSDEVETYRCQFVQCSLELERVKEARDLLEGKVRQWKLTCKSLQHQILRERFGTNQLGHTETFPRPGSAPVVQSNRSLSPESSAMDRPSDASVPSANGLQALPDIADASKTVSTVHNDQDDMETSDESEHRSVPEHPPGKSRSSEDRNVDMRLSRLKESDSSDVVCIGAEPVKGKRQRSSKKVARQPDFIKQEVLSSSAVAQSAFSAAKGVQESMDLDEIIGAIYTPRKDLRKIQRMYDVGPLTLSIQRTSKAWPTTEHPADYRDGRIENHIDNSTFFNDEKIVGDDVPEMRDDAYYQRLGDEHAARLRDEDKRKRAAERRTKQRRHNERQLAKHDDKKYTESRALQRLSAVAQKQYGPTHILRPKDANITLPRTSDISSNKRRRTNPRNSDH